MDKRGETAYCVQQVTAIGATWEGGGENDGDEDDENGQPVMTMINTKKHENICEYVYEP